MAHPAQLNGSDPMPAYESENKEDGGGKGDIDQNEARRTRPSHSHSDIEAVVGSGTAEKSNKPHRAL